MVESNSLKRIFKGFCFLLILLFVIQCASVVTNTQRYKKVESTIRSHKFSSALQTLKHQKKENKYTKKDRLLFYLDLGICYHYADDWKQSNQTLQKADDTIENLYTKSISRLAGSFLLNDNALAYSGEDYENIYVNIFKCINYIELGDFEDAFVEVKKFNEKVERMSLKYDNLITNLNKLKNVKEYDVEFKKNEIKFHNSALARYLSLLMYRATGNYDDAEIDMKSIDNLWATQPDIYDFPQPKALIKSLSRTDKARLNLLSFTGLGPVKKATGFKIATFDDYIIVSGLDYEYTDRILIDVAKGYYFKFSLPEIKSRKSQVDEVRVFVDGKSVGKLETLENFSKVAEASFQVKKSIIYLKTIIRAITKGLAAQSQKQKIDKETGGSLLGKLANAAIDVTVDISENADLRCWRLMPGKCLVGEYFISPGLHHIEIHYLDKRNSIIYKDKYRNFKVKSGRLNLIDSNCLK